MWIYFDWSQSRSLDWFQCFRVYQAWIFFSEKWSKFLSGQAFTIIGLTHYKKQSTRCFLIFVCSYRACGYEQSRTSFARDCIWNSFGKWALCNGLWCIWECVMWICEKTLSVVMLISQSIQLGQLSLGPMSTCFFPFHLYFLSLINEGIWSTHSIFILMKLMIRAFVVSQVKINYLNASSAISRKVDYETIKTVTSLQPSPSRLYWGKKELR